MPSGFRQLALDLPHSEASDIGDFLPAQSNQGAFDAVLAWPDWPATALLVVGPKGAGKTHLARIWARRSGAVVFEDAAIWETARPIERLALTRTAVVDPADDPGDEVELLHLYNVIAERGGHLLLTSELPLGAWRLNLADLRSRLATAWVVRIEPPCDGLLAALLVKQFADRQMRVESGVIDYLVNRMERSFAAVRQVVEALDRASLRARRPVRLALAREVLCALAAGPEAEETTPDPLLERLDQWISA